MTRHSLAFHSIRLAALTTPALLALLMGACASPASLHPIRDEPVTKKPVAQAPRFQWGQAVQFEGMNFTFKWARTTPWFANFVNQRTQAADSFVIVEVTMVNETGSALAVHAQPVFQLVDEAGTVYEVDRMKGIAINMRQPGRAEYGQAINPHGKQVQEVVFDVSASRKYVLQVTVPDSAKVRADGSIAVSGPYFTYDISSQLAAGAI